MTAIRQPLHTSRAFTLLEMTIVIMVLIALMSIGLFTFRKMDEWKAGRAAAEQLRKVYTAQRMYLADNPTAAVTSLTTAMLLPYLPDNQAAMPPVTSLQGANLTYRVTVSPPVIVTAANVVYDPSGSSTDSLWDVGE